MTTTRNNAHLHCAPALQSLESRRMLAGNVTAALDEFGETLVITGDNKANQFIVVAGSNDTTVTGLNGTKVNGARLQPNSTASRTW